MFLAQRLQDTIAGNGIPGAALAYSIGGQVTEVAAGVLNVNTAVTATPDSLFQIGSITKLFTATLIHQLIDEGKVELDRPVRGYLPDFALADNELAESITIRDLLRHTTGFHGDLFTDFGCGEDALARYVDHLADVEAFADRGEFFSYSNAGYCILGRVVATLRNSTWEQAVRRHLIEPLGLSDIAISAQEAIRYRTAVGHITPPDAFEPVVSPVWQLPQSMAPAGSVICASPKSLLEFARVFQQGGREGVLSGEAVARGWDRQVDVPGPSGADAWGLGWQIFDWNGTTVVGHDGNTIGQSAWLRVIPEADFAIAMVANGGEVVRLYADLFLPLIQELTGVVPTPPATPTGSTEAVDTAPLAGEYTSPMVNYRVVADDNGLIVTEIPGDLSRSLGAVDSTAHYEHHSGDSFIRTEKKGGGHNVLTFIGAASGAAEYIHLGRALPRKP